jgi:hypothetical protein
MAVCGYSNYRTPARWLLGYQSQDHELWEAMGSSFLLSFFSCATPNTVTRDKWVCFKHFIYKKYIFFLSTFSTHHFFFIQVKGGEANTPCCQNQENLLGCPQDQRRKL